MSTVPSRIAVLALALTLAIAAPSEATYLGQRPAGSGTTQVAALAQAFWAHRGVNTCPAAITVWQATTLRDADGLAIGRGRNCEVWLMADIAQRLDTSHPTETDLVYACTVVFHETGHAVGLEHTATGVMSVVPEVPWDCRVWSRAHATQALARQARSRPCPDRRRAARKACRSRDGQSCPRRCNRSPR